MMRYLDGKPTDDKHYLAQPYVTSLSLLLVALFKACLCGSLAIAFTQHLWKVMRHEALRVSSIESLHGVRYNPFLLGYWRILHTTPLLYLMAAVMWLLAVVILFPPSALTIVSRAHDTQEPLLVPTFGLEFSRDHTILRGTFIDSPYAHSQVQVQNSSLSTFNYVSAQEMANQTMTYL